MAELKIVDYENKTALVIPINTIQEIDGEKLGYITAKNEKNEIIAKKEQGYLYLTR